MGLKGAVTLVVADHDTAIALRSGSVPVLAEDFQRSLKPGGRLLAVVGEEPVMEALLVTCAGGASYSKLALFETCIPALRNAPHLIDPAHTHGAAILDQMVTRQAMIIAYNNDFRLMALAVVLPLILLQAAGFRRPVRSERGAGLLFGGGVGILYSVTTISGPPLAVARRQRSSTPLRWGSYQPPISSIGRRHSAATAAGGIASPSRRSNRCAASSATPCRIGCASPAQLAASPAAARRL